MPRLPHGAARALRSHAQHSALAWLRVTLSPLQLIGAESGADRCHLALRRRWLQPQRPGSGPPSWAPASVESSFMKQLPRARQGSVGDVGLRAPGTKLVRAAWSRTANGRMPFLAEVSLNKQELGIERIDKQEEGKT